MKRPNLLLIHCHDLGRHLGTYGVAAVQTPRLDRLACEGVLFENSFCTHPTCSPSRAALFTGRYPHATGVLGLTAAHIKWSLAPQEKHLAAILAQSGYRCVLAGLFHEHLPTDFPRLGYHRRLCGSAPAREVAAAACSWIGSEAGAAEPFFLTVGLFEPHRPFDHGGVGPDSTRGVTVPQFIPQESEAQRQAAAGEFAALQGAVGEADRRIGEVLDALDAAGLGDETVVVFTTDHGIAMPRAKGSLYDPGIGIALIVRGPALGGEGGLRSSALVSNVDVLPTLVEGLGIAVPAADSARWQGRSFLAPLRGGDGSRAAVFAEKNFHNTYDPMRCIRTDRHKLIANFEMGPTVVPGDVQVGAVFRASVERFTPHRPPFELYDLHADPWEQVNLAGTPGAAPLEADLKARLRGWMEETADPLLAGPIRSPYFDDVLAGLGAPGA